MFYCQFCNFTTKNRSLIHQHHIKPRELKGENKSRNLVYTCPNCHQIIYIPDATNGQHSKKKENYIEIIGWLQSTEGRVLHYIKENEEFFEEDKNNS